jgi:XTP/dITP diphosphohydrolase
LEESKKILLATSNEGKLKEFKKLFTKFDLVYQTELGINDAIEDGLTFLKML